VTSSPFHRQLGFFYVAAALLGDGPHPLGRELDYLLHLLFGYLLPTRRHRVGGADCCAWCHHGDMRRQGDKRPCRSRPGTAGANVYYDGHVGVHNRLHYPLCRVEQTARRVQLDNTGQGVLVLGFLDATFDVVSHHGDNGALDMEDVD